MSKKEWSNIFAALVLLLLAILILPALTKKEPIECKDEGCLYANFINCTPATLNVEPYDKIGVSSITISGFGKDGCDAPRAEAT